jgi:hypothetical protein
MNDNAEAGAAALTKATTAVARKERVIMFLFVVVPPRSITKRFSLGLQGKANYPVYFFLL